MNKFTIGLIVTVGLLTSGIVYMIGFDRFSENSPYDNTIVNALNNIEYDQFRDNDTHYERVDREKKYYASMMDIETLDDDSIRITFDANHFEFDKNGGYVESKSNNSEFTAMINKDDTFVAGCNFSFMPNREPTDNVPAKQIHVLKYNGITQKDGISYYGFAHEAGYISNDIECSFPDMIRHSLEIDFDISDTNFYGDVWDNDWE